jgi:hypothetical protein
MESITGRHPGRFSGNAEDWPTWRRKWLPFIREIEGVMPTITDAQRLALLRGALDEAGALLIDQELEANPDLGYEEYWAKLDLEFGAEDREVLRRKLHRVKLAHMGKVTEKTWRDLYAQMSTLAFQLGDISDVESSSAHYPRTPGAGNWPRRKTAKPSGARSFLTAYRSTPPRQRWRTWCSSRRVPDPSPCDARASG